MRTDDLPLDPVPGPADVGDRNVERLLGAAYKPEDIDADFARVLTGKLCSVARDLAAERTPTATPTVTEERRRAVLHQRLGWAMGLAASVAAVALFLYAAQRQATPPHAMTEDEHGDLAPSLRQTSSPADTGPGLTPRPRPAAPEVKPLSVGQSLTTRTGERRRITLADGSVLYLNQNTQVTQTARRRLVLGSGEIYLEVAPREQGSGATFIVQTEGRKVSALGTRFAVRAEPQGTGVLVTQGKVHVSDLKEVIHAGQQLAPGGRDVAPAPRASHELDWTRELMTAAESPLVPCSQHGGGALIAVDPSGQEMRLTLRKFHVDVHIEDGFARTTIDQTYFNNENDRLEGTFYFPLPPDASLSRLAMYVAEGGDARLMEGGMAERDHARGVFESIRHARRDPALLEWVDGSTFKMRVFPLEPRQEKRIILGYTQRLSSLYGVTRYRFPGGHNMDFVKEWSFAARVKHGAAQVCSSPTHPGLTLTPEKGDMVLSLKEQNIKPDRDVALEILDKVPAVRLEELARFSSNTHEDQQYLMLRYVPKLVGEPKRERRDWVILFESAANRDPLLARTQIEVIRTLLSNAEHDDTFHVLTVATRTHLFDKQARPATAANVEAACKFLDSAHLVGALDLAGALKTAEPLLKVGKNPYLLHVGAGIAAMGERSEDALAKLIPEGVRYVGVGVGKRWGRNFMKAAADRTGGYFTQINPDESITWRAFDLLATLNTPRLMELRVVDDAERAAFLCDATSLAQGEEIFAVTRVKKGAALPEAVTVAGKLDGKPFVRRIRVREVAEGAGYLPRTWAKLEIDRLLAEDGAKHKNTVVELSKAMYVMSPYTSLLVLETDADYERFKVDRGRKDHWAMYASPARIPIVHEPLWTTRQGAPQAQGQKRSVAQVLSTVLIRVPPQPLSPAGKPNNNPLQAVSALPLYFGAFALPTTGEEFGVEIGLQAPIVYRHGFDFNASEPMEWSDQPLKDRTIGFKGLRYLGANRSPYLNLLKGEAPAWNYYHLVRPDTTAARIQFAPVIVDGSMRWAVPDGLLAEPGFRFGITELEGRHAALLRSFDGWYENGRITEDTLRTHLLRLRAEDGRRFAERQLPSPEELDRIVLRQRLLSDLDDNTKVALDRKWGKDLFRQDKELTLLSMIERSFHDPRLVRRKFSKPGDPAAPRLPVLLGRPELGVTVLSSETVRLLATEGVDPRLIEQAVKEMQGADPNQPMPDSRIANNGGSGRVDEAKLRKLAEGWGRLNPRERKQALTEVADLTRGLSPAHQEAIREYFRKIDPAGKSGQATEKKDLPPIMLASVEALAEELSRRLNGEGRKALLYERPLFTGDPRFFGDLVSHAPGLNTTQADILAVLEAEATGNGPQAGVIDARARALIERARTGGWQAIALPAIEKQAASKFVFNAAGQYAVDHITSNGLREVVICDGAMLLHLYPELGLGGRRAVTRFHRGDLAALVPWVLPPVEDLARGADLKYVDEHTVAVVARDAGKAAAYVQLSLIFAADGRLAERRLVLMPQGKTLSRETYDTDGTVRLYRADETKAVAERKVKVAPAAEPNLTPDTHDLVLVPMPLRTREHIGINGGMGFANHVEESAIALIAAECLQHNGQMALQIFGERFHARGDRRLGFYTLLTAGGVAINPGQAHEWNGQRVRMDIVWEHPNSPLAMYLAYHNDAIVNGDRTALGELDGPADGFVQKFASFRDLWRRWHKDPNHNDLEPVRTRVQAYLKSAPSPLLVWALLDAVEGRSASAPAEFRQVLADARLLAGDALGLGYAARYERARFLVASGDHGKGREAFRQLHADALKAGILPPINDVFRTALQNAPANEVGWMEWMRQAGTQAAKENGPLSVVGLAWQAHQLGDRVLAEELFDIARTAAGESNEGRVVGLSTVEYLLETKQFARAGVRLEELLKDETVGRSPRLWRLASSLATKRNLPGRAVVCMEKALDLEYCNLPEMVNLDTLRADYGTLLNQYQQMATALTMLDTPASQEFLAKVIRAADRWRALDPENAVPCQVTGKILRSVGAGDLAWDYLTTPIGLKPNEAAPWVGLAQSLRSEGELDLADRAYATAFESERTNAQILWDRAQNLQQAGRLADAQRVYRQLAEGTWQERFQGLRQQAQAQLQGR